MCVCIYRHSMHSKHAQTFAEAYCFIVSCFYFSFSQFLTPTLYFLHVYAGRCLQCAEPKISSDVLFYAHHFQLMSNLTLYLNTWNVILAIWISWQRDIANVYLADCRWWSVIYDYCIQNKYYGARKNRQRIHVVQAVLTGSVLFSNSLWWRRLSISIWDAIAKYKIYASEMRQERIKNGFFLLKFSSYQVYKILIGCFIFALLLFFQLS